MECSSNLSLFPEGIPYRATKMWNELVRHFKDGIELKKKRWRMKYYYNCFSGSEAVAWIHEYLRNNPNYGRNVTRTQAQLLCQKFLRQNVLKDILPSSQIAGALFEESRLYCFTDKPRFNKAQSLKDDESKENKHLKDCSTRKGTPRVKKRPSVLENDERKPLEERKGLTNITKELASKKVTSKAKSKSNYKDYVIMSNKLVTKPIHNDDGNITKTKLSRKWQSECNVSVVGRHNDALRKKPSMLQSPRPSEKVNTLVKSSSETNFNANISYSETQTMNPEVETIDCTVTQSEITSSTCTETINKTSESITATCTSATTTSTNNKTTTGTQKKYNELWKDISLKRLEYILNVSSLNEILDYSLLDGENVKENVNSNFKLVLQSVPTWVVAAMKYLIHWPNSKNLPGIGPDYVEFEKDVFKTIADYFQSMSDPLVPRCFLEIFTKISGLSTQCKLSAIRALQYALLLLEKNKRQQLQLLLRFMIKVSKNHVLNLSKDLPIRELVIQTFAPPIFSGNQNTGLTEVLGIRIASFAMDNYVEIFKVPTGLQYEVEQHIVLCQQNETGNGKRKCSNAVTYCHLITNEEYQEQVKLETERSLKRLLNSIVNDESSNEKERRKKLKQFQKTYPEVYFSRFPTDGLSMLSRRSERSVRHVIKPLGSIMKSLR